MIVIKNSRIRLLIKIIVPFVVIPMIVFFGSNAFGAKKHLFLSFIVAVFALVLFLSGFERKKTGSRRLVIVAVMTALGIVGRFIPFFKPITALTIITAIYLGGEAGFLVGALSALLSNFYFGQGPWTPFQMLAWGMIGLIAGYLALPLKEHRISLVLYGVVSGALYSFIMDIWSVMWYNEGLSLSVYTAGIIAALPHTLLYMISNFLFLWFLAPPFGEKLERVKLKYGV